MRLCGEAPVQAVLDEGPKGKVNQEIVDMLDKHTQAVKSQMQTMHEDMRNGLRHIEQRQDAEANSFRDGQRRTDWYMLR